MGFVLTIAAGVMLGIFGAVGLAVGWGRWGQDAIAILKRIGDILWKHKSPIAGAALLAFALAAYLAYKADMQAAQRVESRRAEMEAAWARSRAKRGTSSLYDSSPAPMQIAPLPPREKIESPILLDYRKLADEARLRAARIRAGLDPMTGEPVR